MNSQVVQDARNEARLIALYVELTGASENLARNAYAHLETIHDPDGDWNTSWRPSDS